MLQDHLGSLWCCKCVRAIIFSPQVGKGLVRVMRGDENGIADLVPVDLVNNAILSVGWVTGVNPTPQPIIYNYTSGNLNPIKWIELCELKDNFCYI